VVLRLQAPSFYNFELHCPSCGTSTGLRQQASNHLHNAGTSDGHQYAEWRKASWSKGSDLEYYRGEDVSLALPQTLQAETESTCRVADIIRSCLGPKAMLKMLLDPMGGIVLTNDGHAILREIEVAHPAAKSMIELSRTQDEEVGDGTTTVIILGIPSMWSSEASV
jgi:TCP-1/cpn60 chaperonin family